MEQVLFQDFFQPPSRTSMKSANVFVKFVKSYLSKVVKEIHFHQTPTVHRKASSSNWSLKHSSFWNMFLLFGIYFIFLEYIFSFLEYISSFWNMIHIFGMYFPFLEHFPSFGNIFPLFGIFHLFGIYFPFLEYISSFWNIFPHQTVLNHAIYRLIQ